MEFKKITGAGKKVDVSEWFDAEAFVKSMTVLEQITFYNLLGEYADEKAEANKRAEAGAAIAVLLLTDAEGNQLLTTDDIDQIKAASYEPIGRIIRTASKIEEGREKKE